MVPLGVCAMAVSTAVFPTLARHSAANEQAEMRELFGLTLRMILFLTVPATVGLVILGRPIIELLFERDLFTVAVTDAVLIALRATRWGCRAIASWRSWIAPSTPCTTRPRR